VYFKAKIEFRDWYAEFPTTMDSSIFEPAWPPPPRPPTAGSEPVAHVDLTVKTWTNLDHGRTYEESADDEDKMTDVEDITGRNAAIINQTSHRYEPSIRAPRVSGGDRTRHVTINVIQLVGTRFES